MLRDVVRAARSDPVVAAQCHMALHPIGNDSGNEFARRGQPLPLRRPSNFCEEGFVHGLQIAWLSSASSLQLRRDGVRACSAANSDADWTCGHSLGHAFAKAAGDNGRMATVTAWCQEAWGRAVHLGLDHDSFLSTCTRGATMEMSFTDARLNRHAPRRPCAGVASHLVLFCDAHVWMRLDPGVSSSPKARRTACLEFTRTLRGRAACIAMMTRPDRLTVANDSRA